MRNWQVKHRSGRLQFNQGFVRIQIAGFYFVYSQMFYHDGLPYQVSHQLFVNSDKFMESTSAVVSEDRKYNTNYNGGVVFLNTTDTVSVQTPFSNHYFMNPSSSYFGLFLLHPTETWPSDSKLFSRYRQLQFYHMFRQQSLPVIFWELDYCLDSVGHDCGFWIILIWSFCNLPTRYRTYT